MIISVTLSKPTAKVEEILGKSYEKIKIKAVSSGKTNSKEEKFITSYFVEMFTKKQVFHNHFSEEEVNVFLKNNIGITFKNCIEKTETEIITFLTNKKGKVTRISSPLKQDISSKNEDKLLPQRKKNYLIEEGNPVPFLCLLGIMNDEGKVISSKYDKFKQINRFLEFINDTIKAINKNFTSQEPLRIVDFGCGKSYLTFAVHYFLSEIKKIPCIIEGLDLKEEVIQYCNEITGKLQLKNLFFHTGNIESYKGSFPPNIIITLHACDTATDYALKYAVEKKADAILSVPCCQHQINSQLSKSNNLFLPLLKYGIIKEKFSALLTDALRGEWLENQGYKVQLLEFIDIEHTPKNILIRAIREKNDNPLKNQSEPEIIRAMNIKPEIWKKE